MISLTFVAISLELAVVGSAIASIEVASPVRPAPAAPASPLSPFSPFGITKSRIMFVVSPLFVTVASVPASPVVP